MPRWLPSAALLLVVAPLSACGLGDALGLNKRAPDEFAVVRRQPLVVPPDFELRPPRPGAVRPQTGTAGDQARATLTGREGQPERPASPAPADRPGAAAAPSAGQEALLARTAPPDPGSRLGAVSRRDDGDAVDATLLERLIEWQPPDPLAGDTSAPASAQNLLTSPDADRSGRASETPIVVRRDQTRLDDIEEPSR